MTITKLVSPGGDFAPLPSSFAHAAAETWAGTEGTFANLPTPTILEDVEVGPNGLVAVHFRAQAKRSNNPTGNVNVNLYVDGFPFRYSGFGGAAYGTMQGTIGPTATFYSNVGLAVTGFQSWAATANDTITLDPAEPQVMYPNSGANSAALPPVEIGPGLHDFEIRWLVPASGGTLQVRQRKLVVIPLG